MGGSSSGAELAIPLGGSAFPLGFTIGQLWDIGRLFPRSLGFALDPVRALLSPPIPSTPLFTFLTGRAGRFFLLLQGTNVIPKYMPWRIALN